MTERDRAIARAVDTWLRRHVGAPRIADGFVVGDLWMAYWDASLRRVVTTVIPAEYADLYYSLSSEKAAPRNYTITSAGSDATAIKALP